MPQRCVACQKELAEEARFCTACGSNDLVTTVSSTAGGFEAPQAASPTPAPSVSEPILSPSSSASSSSVFTAPLPAARELQANTARIPMDAREFGDFLGSLSRGLMKDADQIKKIKAAASGSNFTCEQAIAMAAVVKGHPGEAIITLYPSLVDADVANFTKVLRALKWVEERQEVLAGLKLDASKYAEALKK